MLSLALVTMLGHLSTSYACNAKNDAGDVCETNCAAGEVAHCSNGVGATAPSCSCTKGFTTTEMAALPADQQEAIRKVLISANLLTPSGEVKKLTGNDFPKKQSESIHKSLTDAGFNSFQTESFFGCLGARVGEAAAVAGCALIPGGQLVIAICVAAAHAAANEACK